MGKALTPLQIDEEFQKVAPPLMDYEYSLLKEDLLEHGCLSPIITWNGVIIDGHNRYRICQENGIPFAIEEMSFEDKSEAKIWAAKNQIARRNMIEFQRCEMFYSLEPEVKAQAAKRQKHINDEELVPTLAPAGKSRDILAGYAKVSHGTWDKAKLIIENADEETKKGLRDGKTKIHTVYRELLKHIPGKKARSAPANTKMEPQNERQPTTAAEDTPPLSPPVQEPEVQLSKPVPQIDWKNDPRRPTIAQPIEVRPIQNPGPATNQQIQDRFASAVETFVDTTEIALKWITEENAAEINWETLLRKVKKGMNRVETSIQEKRQEVMA